MPKNVLNKSTSGRHSARRARNGGMLGPKLACACKSTVWAQAKTLDPVKLTDLKKAVDTLLSASASWEESADMKTYEIVELALCKAAGYSTA